MYNIGTHSSCKMRMKEDDNELSNDVAENTQVQLCMWKKKSRIKTIGNKGCPCSYSTNLDTTVSNLALKLADERSRKRGSKIIPSNGDWLIARRTTSFSGLQ